MADLPTPEAEEPETVEATAPDGTVYDLPIDKIEQAKAMHWDVEDPHESTASQFGTVAEGLASAVPFAPKIEAKLFPKIGSIEEQKARAEANPLESQGSHLAGDVIQMGAVAAATGGLGLGAEAAGALGEGAEALSPAIKAASAVADGAAPEAAAAAADATPAAVDAAADAAVAQPAASAGEAAARVPAYGAQGAAGAVNSGTNYLNESELGDHDFNGEAMVMAMGLGTIMNIGGEKALHVLGESVVPKVLEKAGEAIDSLKGKIGDALVNVVERVNPEAAGKVRPAWEAIRAGKKGVTDAMGESMASSIDDLGSELEKVGKAHNGENGYRQTEAGKNLQDLTRDQVLGTDGQPGLLQFKAQVEQEMGRVKQMVASKTYHDVGAIDSTERALNKLEGVMGNTEATGAELHQAAREFKQDVGAGLFQKGGVRTPEAQAAINDIKQNIWGATKTMFSDQAIWGEEQASKNVLLDSLESRKINSAKRVAKAFGIKDIDLDTGQQELRMSPSKFRNAFRGDELANREKLNALSDYVDASGEYLKGVKGSAGEAGAVVPSGQELEDLLKKITEQRGAADQAGAVSRLQAALGRGSGASDVTNIGAVGFGLHALGASNPLAAGVAGLYAAAKAPVRSMEVLAKVAAASEAASRAIGSGVRKIMSSPVGRTAVVGGTINALRGRTMPDHNGNPAGNDFGKQQKHILAMASDQQRQLNAVSQSTSRLSDHAPLTALSTQSTAYRLTAKLAELIPKNPAPSMLAAENQNWEPDPTSRMIWDDQHAVLLHPPLMLQQLWDGSAMPDTWQALTEVYPKYTEQIQQQTINHLTQHPKMDLDQGQRFAISMILGSPVSPSVAPEQIAEQQSIYIPAGGPPPQSGKGGTQKKPTQHGMDKIDLGQRSALGPASRRRA